MYVLSLVAHGSGLCSEIAWHAGFEQDFPSSAWSSEGREGYSASGKLPAGRVSAWTIVDRQSGEPVFGGQRAYKGWIVAPAGESHRAYPVIHVDIPTPVINTFFIYLDADYSRIAETEWISIGTWGNYDPGTSTGKWALHTAAVRRRKLEFAHTTPFHGEYIGPQPQPHFPLRRWVRITVYIIYEGATGFVQLWQDGARMLRATVPELSRSPGTRLRTAHWGMYASGTLGHGVQYNDEIRICTLDSPLLDLVREPNCNGATSVN